MISAAQLSIARNQMARMLTDTCEHFSKVTDTDDTFVTTSEYVSQGNVSCLIYASQGTSISSEIKEVGETKADSAEHIFRFAWDAEVSVGDKLETSDGSEFLVVSDGDNDTNRFILQVGAERIRGDKF